MSAFHWSASCIGIASPRFFGIGGTAVVNNKPCIRAAFYQGERIVELCWLNGDLEMFIEFAQVRDGMNKPRLQAKP